jgi:hypothetical protein
MTPGGPTGGQTTSQTSGQGTSTGSGSSSGTGSPSIPPPEACPCTAEACGITVPECGGESLCPSISDYCERPDIQYGCMGQELIIDEEAVLCALDAFAQRTPGTISWSQQTGQCGFEGCVHTSATYQLFGEDMIISTQCNSTPLEDPDGYVVARELAPASHFEACKTLPSPAAMRSCMFDGLGPNTLVSCQ